LASAFKISAILAMVYIGFCMLYISEKYGNRYYFYEFQ